MNQYVTGTMIRELREKNGLTQLKLAEMLQVSDKTVSKWETGKGYPDISLLEPISRVLHVSLAELLSGQAVTNRNVSANMLRAGFYVCPLCGNVLCSTGEASVSCHGIILTPAQAEPADDKHAFSLEPVEDEYVIRIEHEMTKAHYISFIAALSSDAVQIIKLYPEGPSAARIKRRGVRKIVYYCNRDGLFDAGKIITGKNR